MPCHAMQVKVVSCINSQWNLNLFDAFESTSFCFFSVSATAAKTRKCKQRWPNTQNPTSELNSYNQRPTSLPSRCLSLTSSQKLTPRSHSSNHPHVPILGLGPPQCWTNCNSKGLAMNTKEERIKRNCREGGASPRQQAIRLGHKANSNATKSCPCSPNQWLQTVAVTSTHPLISIGRVDHGGIVRKWLGWLRQAFVSFCRFECKFSPKSGQLK
jgi:hypothetical protein